MRESVDRGYRLLAAKYLRKQANELDKELDGVCQAVDVEFIHRSRVATRRLRAGLRMFARCFPARRVKKWTKGIRRITAGLGDARDSDVQIEFLDRSLDQLQQKAPRPGIVRLLVKFERQRERAQPRVLEAVRRLRAGGVVKEIRAAAKKVVRKARKHPVDVRSPVAFQQTERHILDNLEAMLSYRDSLDDAQAVQRHHAMRVAAKRLRYTLEISSPVYGAALDESITVGRTLQTLLGEVHDCDVWLEQLDRFAASQRRRIIRRFGHPGPFSRLATGIDYLRRQRQERRHEVFGQLVDYWRQLEQTAAWDRLVEIVREHGRQVTAEDKSAEPSNGQGPSPSPTVPLGHRGEPPGSETVESSPQDGQDPPQQDDVSLLTTRTEGIHP